jgi:hypothetical protein
MPGVNDRRARPTIPFDSQRLARESEEDPEALEEGEFELADPPASHPRVVSQTSRLASGTTPPQGARRVTGTDPPEIRSRTSTVHDPLTTSVLAEIARRALDDDTDR